MNNSQELTYHATYTEVDAIPATMSELGLDLRYVDEWRAKSFKFITRCSAGYFELWRIKPCRVVKYHTEYDWGSELEPDGFAIDLDDHNPTLAATDEVSHYCALWLVKELA